MNILIVNFNTQELTDACIMSVNKHTPGCTIYVFDNSDEKPFINTFKNVNVIDNTKGQIIDFDEWIKKYPKATKLAGTTNNWGSAKHTYTIENCINLIQDGFILLDSDVLVKKNLMELYDENFIYVGEVGLQPRSRVKRVFPFVCYINSQFCIKNNVHYFDEKKMHGLRVTGSGDKYDTGAAFYLNAEKFPHKEIKYADYIVHLKGGSWFESYKKIAKNTQKVVIDITPEIWLNHYRYLWDENVEEPVDKEEFVVETKIVEEKKKPIVIKNQKKKLIKKQEPDPVIENVDKKAIVEETKFTPKKTTIEEDKRVVFKRPVHKQQTEHATSVSQVKKFALTGRKVALIKRS